MYGEPSWDHKDRIWAAMRSLKNNVSNSLPWLVIGNFNEILYHYEKEGGRARSQRQLQDFHDALDDCELVDIGFNYGGYMAEKEDTGMVGPGCCKCPME